MRKSIKYAGIAAATLLAVAPIAAPVFNLDPTTVKADTTPSDDEIKTAINDLASTLQSKAYKNDASDPFPNLTYDNANPGEHVSGTFSADPSFSGGAGATAAAFINDTASNYSSYILHGMDTSSLTSADKDVLSNNNVAGNIKVVTQVEDSNGNLISIPNGSLSPEFFNFLDTIKNIRDNGGALKLTTTISYKDVNKAVKYTLTNKKIVSANVDQVKDAVKDFEGQLHDVTLKNGNNRNLAADMLYNYPATLTGFSSQRVFRGFYNDPAGQNAKFSSYDLFKSLASLGVSLGDISATSQKAFLDNNINIVVTAKDQNGKVIDTTKSLNDITTDIKQGFKLDFSFQYPDTNGNIQTIDDNKEVTFAPEPELTNVKATYDDAIHVKDGSQVSDASDPNFTFEDSNGTKTPISSTLYESAFYANSDDAWNEIVTNSGNNQIDVGDKFDASKGTEYYQIMKASFSGLEFNSPIRTFMNNWVEDSNWSEGEPVTYKLNINGKTMPQFENSANPNDPTQTYVNSQMILYIRKVIVDKTASNNSGSNSAVQSISGIVTTHTDKDHYALYNDKNDKVDNRALINDSSWQVDGVRNINGVKQYRVSAHEWVNASDVDFIENGEVVEGMTVKKLNTPKEINLATNHKIYNLQNSKQKVSSVRALAGGTSWLVDKIGTDVHGGIYYGVSTDEFVKASDGVNVVK
ncbi:hypothetical protein [Companilactobacillus keshanensis]|uniref:Surface layer protein A domain-containing protein n=1 Tax=Companilactobacillus keshanensis TaxID=2486003 RepID=A0ABW4BUC4_9LACO|nr:hypothetical protein [Companilactobacillus keshanensis]